MAGRMEKNEKESSLLINIMNEDDPPSEARIQKVPDALKNETNKTCFNPKVVSLGPYHYHQADCLQPMNWLKEKAVRWFVSLNPCSANSGDKVMKIYHNFVSIVPSLKDWYAAETIEKLDVDIRFLMFVDGCFILYFVYHWKTKDIFVGNIKLTHPSIVSDMFLLENQIPYVVLKSLMSLMPQPNSTLTKQDIEQFIEKALIHEPLNTSSWTICGTFGGTFDRICRAMSTCLRKRGDPNPNPSTSKSDKDPLHLLDFLRTKLIGSDHSVDESPRAYPLCYFRSIRELKAKGIKLRKSNSNHLNTIEFKKCLIYGYLSLPQLIVEDRTRTQLLNLMAYEMCPDCNSDRVITSYVCFLDSLIDDRNDVKELRSEGILINCLGSDKEVAKLFNEVTDNVTPNSRVYGNTKKMIRDHCESNLKVWFAELLHTHFSSPWTVISLTAVTFLLFLTVVQTVFTVWY